MIGALVGRELADVERVRLRPSAVGADAAARSALDVDRIGDDLEPRARQLRRARAQVAGDDRADRDDRARRRQRRSIFCAMLRAQVAPAPAACARPDDARCADGRAASPRRASSPGTARSVRWRVDQVGPVADRPVVADGDDTTGCRAVAAASTAGGADRTCCPWTMSDLRVARSALRAARASRRIEPLVLEVVADARHVRRVGVELDDAECRRSSCRCLARRSSGDDLDDHARRGRAPQARAPARRCSSRCRRMRRERVGRRGGSSWRRTRAARDAARRARGSGLPAVVSRTARARAPRRRAAAAAAASAAAARARPPARRGPPDRRGAFAPVADERRDARDGRRDHRQSGRHVLEDLQRRPVEAERQRLVRADVERRHADVRRPPAPPASASCGSAPVKTTSSRPAASACGPPAARGRRR